LGELHAELSERLLGLAAANEELQQQVTMRSRAETTLRKSQQSSGQLLEDSQGLEQQLRDMTRQILSATESERRKMSRYLNDEIAQTLLGINMRFLALKNEVAATHADLTREIAATQRLVTAAAKTISTLAHEFRNQQT
jgi:signal transduction histidine kinase